MTLPPWLFALALLLIPVAFAMGAWVTFAARTGMSPLAPVQQAAAAIKASVIRKSAEPDAGPAPQPRL